jgi:hypothetical protein
VTTGGGTVLQEGSVVTCESKVHSVACVCYIGVHRIMTEPGPAASGFAILTPLPVEMWGPSTVVKLSLRRICEPSDTELATALEREHAKMPACLAVVQKGMDRSVMHIDAGHRLQEMSFEVCSLCHRLLAVQGFGHRFWNMPFDCGTGPKPFMFWLLHA